jgi:hypothetical protein
MLGAGEVHRTSHLTHAWRQKLLWEYIHKIISISQVLKNSKKK